MSASYQKIKNEWWDARVVQLAMQLKMDFEVFPNLSIARLMRIPSALPTSADGLGAFAVTHHSPGPCLQVMGYALRANPSYGLELFKVLKR